MATTDLPEVFMDRGVRRSQSRRWAHIYLRFVDLRGRVRRGTDAFVDGLWLGVLGDSVLTEIDELFYRRITESVDGRHRRYTDPEHVRQGLAVWELAAVSRFPAGARVVVTAAGAGREVWGLEALGFDVTGFEPNAELVRAGRLHLPNPERLRPGVRDAFPKDAGSADAVVIGWGSYMLVKDRPTRIRLLADARDSLRPEGLLLVSFFVRPPSKYFGTVHRVSSVLRRVRGKPPREMGDALSPNLVHYFTRAEIEAEIQAAGLELLTYESTPYGHALARKPPSA